MEKLIDHLKTGFENLSSSSMGMEAFLAQTWKHLIVLMGTSSLVILRREVELYVQHPITL